VIGLTEQQVHRPRRATCEAVEVRERVSPKGGEAFSRRLGVMVVAGLLLGGVFSPVAARGSIEPGRFGAIPVGNPGVTTVGDPNAPTTAQIPPTQPPNLIPTNVPPETPVPVTLPPTVPATIPATIVTSTTRRGVTTTRRRGTTRRTTTRRGAKTTLPVVTTVILDPLPDGGSTIAPPIEAGPSTSGPVGETTPPPTEPVDTAPDSVAGSSTVPKATTTAPAATPDQLRARVQTEIAKAGGTPGVLVLVDGKPLVDLGSTQARLPASTQKLYVAATAFALFGADYRFETRVKAEPVSNGTTTSLTLIGAGDPSLTTSDLRSLAKAVAASGIKSITTRLNVDDSHFDRITTGPGWKPSFSPGESGLLSALMVDGNQRNDPAFRADPALANLAKFQQELQRAGVVVTGASLGRSSAPDNASVVASHKSEPFSVLLSVMGKKSNNTYAEMILKEIGSVGGAGSTQGGAAAVMAYVQKIGAAAPVTFADGSGLSSLNRTTAASEVGLLLKVDAGKDRAAFRSSLAVACVDGTMKSRLCGTVGQGKVIAKTGTINGVSALSGYTVTASGRKVVFAFLLNGLKSNASGRLAIDRALLQILGYVG
jgi:serine-type D-Ala-D-Ala carboxypeptidase/endopeptidase (penicillin-binding protein 4)